MPWGGRGFGRRRRIISFLQPCLLVLLRRDQAHGYSLLNDLVEFGFDPEFLDPSLVYRALREMEMMGLVTSEWSDESLGPQRRIYRVTPAGEEYLAQWIADLRQTRREIDALLAAYDATPRPGSSQEESR
ncbi:MAG: helix-turn-helix transcriptional regulator [Anaerolineae bacterium]